MLCCYFVLPARRLCDTAVLRTLWDGARACPRTIAIGPKPQYQPSRPTRTPCKVVACGTVDYSRLLAVGYRTHEELCLVALLNRQRRSSDINGSNRQFNKCMLREPPMWQEPPESAWQIAERDFPLRDGGTPATPTPASPARAQPALLSQCCSQAALREGCTASCDRVAWDEGGYHSSRRPT